MHGRDPFVPHAWITMVCVGDTRTDDAAPMVMPVLIIFVLGFLIATADMHWLRRDVVSPRTRVLLAH